MTDFKGGGLKSPFAPAPRALALLAPLACLAAFAAGVPLPLPAFLLPSASYLMLRTGSPPEALSTRAGTPVVLADRVVPAPGDTAAAADLARRLPARPAIRMALADAEGRRRPVRLLMDSPPLASEVAAARSYIRATGMPVRFVDVGTARKPGPVAASSLRVDPLASSSPLNLLLTPAAARAGRVDVEVDGVLLASVEGPSLPVDRRLTVPVGPGDAVIRVTARSPYGDSSVTLRAAAAAEDGPRVLVASAHEGSRTVVEALYPARRIAPAALATADLYAHELVVLDGVPLSSIGQGAASRLAEYAARGAGSVLVSADSPEFGREGDAPALEAVLPVDLAPRSLKNLPDLAMLILIDTSGSMFGDKLSLAKVTGLEVLGNLKPGDLVGMMLFSEGYEWLYRFEPNAGIEPRSTLAPLRAGGSTRLYPALAEGLAALEAAPMAVKHVVLVSDGITEPAEFDALVARALRSGISLSAMAVGDDYDRALLTRLSAGTGGRLYRVRSADEIPSLILEDRRSVSRAMFVEQRERILALDGSDAGWVDGMARFTARAGAMVPFSSAAGDPLLATVERAGRSVMVLASDLEGRYTADFFGEPAVMAMFRSMLDSRFREEAPGVAVAETAEGLSVSVHGDYLAEPDLALADASGAIAAEAAMDRVAPGRFSAFLAPPAAGRYTALLSDRGTTVARFAVYANAGLSGSTEESAAAADAYRPPFFALLPGRASWLLAFFALSLAVTVYLRMSRT